MVLTKYLTLYKCIRETNVTGTTGFSGEKGDTGLLNEIERDVNPSHRISDPLGKQVQREILDNRPRGPSGLNGAKGNKCDIRKIGSKGSLGKLGPSGAKGATLS